jgi:hypothetical protein
VSRGHGTGVRRENSRIFSLLCFRTHFFDLLRIFQGFSLPENTHPFKDLCTKYIQWEVLYSLYVEQCRHIFVTSPSVVFGASPPLYLVPVPCHIWHKPPPYLAPALRPICHQPPAIWYQPPSISAPASCLIWHLPPVVFDTRPLSYLAPSPPPPSRLWHHPPQLSLAPSTPPVVFGTIHPLSRLWHHPPQSSLAPSIPSVVFGTSLPTYLALAHRRVWHVVGISCSLLAPAPRRILHQSLAFGTYSPSYLTPGPFTSFR